MIRTRALLLPVLAAAGGCGYSVAGGFAGGGHRTVGVEVAGNATFRQRLEIPLTREILAALPVYTPLLPGSPATSDTVLRVEIEDVVDRTLVTGQQPVLEGALVFSVRARLVDRRSGAVLVDRVVRERAEFRSPVGENARTARDEGLADLARKIVLALEPDF